MSFPSPSQFEGKVIKCRAAVAWKASAPLTIEEIEVQAPKAGEVRFKLASSGMCHSDWFMLSGNKFADYKFPAVLGHEGSGIVESVGEGVTRLKPGDHVIPLYMEECGECKYCRRPETNLCEKITATQTQGVMPDGTSRFSCRGQTVYHFMGCSTFSEYSVTPEIALCKIDSAAPLDKVCILGCAIPTGMGAAINTGGVKEGATVAIWGLGGVGLAAAMGAKLAGATRIIGIDVQPKKFEIGKTFGCTEFVNPKDHDKPIQQVLVEMTDGGVDIAIECCGFAETTRAAFESCHKGWGIAVTIGLVVGGREVCFQPWDLIEGRTWKGSLFGGYKPMESLPQLVQYYMEGRILLDEFITEYIPLEKINDGFDNMMHGKGIRTVINY